MIEFSEKQIEVLSGNFSRIGKAVGCTREYVSKVIRGKVKTKRKSPKAKAVVGKANELLAVFEPQEIKSAVDFTRLFGKSNDYGRQLIVSRDIINRTNNETTILDANEKLKNEISEKVKLIDDLSAFAHTVAHDLRDSICTIITATDLIQLEMKHGNHQPVPEINNLVRSSAYKTLYIMKELLTLATIRQQDIRLEQVDMGKIIAESENRLNDLIQETTATIIKPDKWPAIKAKPVWLEEVWVNYINNAIKYGGTPPVIELGAEQLNNENKIKFWIKDNGDGITKKEQEKLFTEFSRLETTRAQGTGLGLSIVKRIINKLGGEVGVSSNGVRGEGCIFYFILSVS